MDSTIRVWADKRPCVGSDIDGIRVFPATVHSTPSITIRSTYQDMQVDDTWRLSKSLQKLFHEGSSQRKINDLSSWILSSNQLRAKFKREDFELVAAYRDFVDAYTNQPVRSVEKPEIDHVVEIQCLSYVLAKVLFNNQKAIIETSARLKPCINVVENYNITTANLNAGKMNIFKAFLRDKIDHGIPLCSLMIGTQCEAHMHRIMKTFSDSHRRVMENVNGITFSSNSLSESKNLRNVSEEFDEFLNLLQLDDLSITK